MNTELARRKRLEVAPRGLEQLCSPGSYPSSPRNRGVHPSPERDPEVRPYPETATWPDSPCPSPVGACAGTHLSENDFRRVRRPLLLITMEAFRVPLDRFRFSAGPLGGFTSHQED